MASRVLPPSELYESASACGGDGNVRARKRAREGPSSERQSRLGRSGAQAGRTEGGDEAKRHQEGWSEAVERAFEANESHDTHTLWFLRGTPGERGLSVWTPLV